MWCKAIFFELADKMCQKKLVKETPSLRKISLYDNECPSLIWRRARSARLEVAGSSSSLAAADLKRWTGYEDDLDSSLASASSMASVASLSEDFLMEATASGERLKRREPCSPMTVIPDAKRKSLRAFYENQTGDANLHIQEYPSDGADVAVFTHQGTPRSNGSSSHHPRASPSNFWPELESRRLFHEGSGDRDIDIESDQSTATNTCGAPVEAASILQDPDEATTGTGRAADMERPEAGTPSPPAHLLPLNKKLILHQR